MAAGSASSSAAEDANLLYPELMSAATIVKILKERYVKHPRLEELDKPALVQLYEKTVLPLPQREYRDTRTGRALVALRERANSRCKRKASTDASSDPPSKKQQCKPSTSRAREPPHDKRREGKSAEAERRGKHESSADPTQRANHSKPDAPEDDRRRSRPNEASSKPAANDGDKWGSWDDEPKSKNGKTSATNRCHGEGDGPPRKKHRTPITWP